MEAPAHLDVFNPGDKSALACTDVPELQPILTAQLNGAGYRTHIGTSIDDALRKLRAQPYDLLVITENFAATNLATNPILADTAHMTPSQRHKLFVVLIGASLATGNEWQAFQYSVDLVVGLPDASNLKPVLLHGLAKAQDFYARYFEVLANADSPP